MSGLKSPAAKCIRSMGLLLPWDIATHRTALVVAVASGVALLTQAPAAAETSVPTQAKSTWAHQVVSAKTKKGEAKPVRRVQARPKKALGKGAGSKSGAPRDSGPEETAVGRNTAMLGFGPAFYWQEATREFDQQIGGQTFNEPDDAEFEGKTFFNINAWVTVPVFVESLRAGLGLVWHNNYSLQPPDNEDEDDVYVVGHMFQVYGSAEFVIWRVVSQLNVFVGGRAGFSTVFAGEDLQDELDAFEQREFSTSVLPSFGLFASPHIGVSWPLSERVSVRSDLGVQFDKLWLYDVEAESNGITTQSASLVKATRTQWLLGVQFGL